MFFSDHHLVLSRNLPHEDEGKLLEENFFFHAAWPLFFEDNHLLVLYKPAGLLVQADDTGDLSLLKLGKAWLKARYNKPGNVFLGMVHRLDRPVAGVIVFCRTSKAASRLSESFRTAKVVKRYVAVLEGRLTRKEGYLLNHMERLPDRSSRIVPEPTTRSREARLSFRLLDSSQRRSLVAIQLETGRRHQIRLQFAQIGFPILGDLRYGASAPLPQAQIALLAHELSFQHPTKKEMLSFSCPFPQGWPWRVEPGDLKGPVWNWSDLKPLVPTLQV